MSLQAGDLVLRKVFENIKVLGEGKLGANWESPYKVARVGGNRIYHLEHMDETLITMKWNIAKLRKYYP